MNKTVKQTTWQAFMFAYSNKLTTRSMLFDTAKACLRSKPSRAITVGILYGYMIKLCKENYNITVPPFVKGSTIEKTLSTLLCNLKIIETLSSTDKQKTDLASFKRLLNSNLKRVN